MAFPTLFKKRRVWQLTQDSLVKQGLTKSMQMFYQKKKLAAKKMFRDLKICINISAAAATISLATAGELEIPTSKHPARVILVSNICISNCM